jgi:hypothetical protein
MQINVHEWTYALCTDLYLEIISHLKKKTSTYYNKNVNAPPPVHVLNHLLQYSYMLRKSDLTVNTKHAHTAATTVVNKYSVLSPSRDALCTTSKCAAETQPFKLFQPESSWQGVCACARLTSLFCTPGNRGDAHGNVYERKFALRIFIAIFSMSLQYELPADTLMHSYKLGSVIVRSLLLQ